MGSVYKRLWKDKKTGQIHESSVCWIKYYRDGVPVRESAETEKESEVRRLLKLREGDIARGTPILPWAGKVKFSEISGIPKSISPPIVFANAAISDRNSFLWSEELVGNTSLYSMVFPSGT